MPELPEVETIRSQLNNILPLKIKEVCRFPKLKKILHTKIPKSIEGSQLIQVDRHGKGLIFRFSGDQNQYVLFSQLGMTGGWRIFKGISLLELQSQVQNEKHLHLTFGGTIFGKENCQISYIDPRRFGHLYFWTEEELQNYLDKLGIDVASPQLTEDYIVQQFQRYPKRTLKRSLLDQKLFAGVGNYLANEICAHARLLPTRLGGEISSRDGKKLLEAFKRALDSSLKSQGTTFQGGYLDTNGERGEGVKHLVVFYQKICGLCKKREVTKIYLDGRGTYYCDRCQK